MALSQKEIIEVQTKVFHTDADNAYNSYLDILERVSKLSYNILNGTLEESDYETTAFNEVNMNKLKQQAQLAYINLQTSMDMKKTKIENWDQSNKEKLQKTAEHVDTTLPILRDMRENIQNKMRRLRNMYDSVETLNQELMTISKGRLLLVATKSEWESKLGAELTSKLIEERYLTQNDKNSRYITSETKYQIYDSFGTSVSELQHINRSLKSDLNNLKGNVEVYKEKWMEDSKVLMKVADVLKEEMIKRNMIAETPDIQGSDDEWDEEDEERYNRQVRHDSENEDLEEESDKEMDDISANEEEEEEETKQPETDQHVIEQKIEETPSSSVEDKNDQDMEDVQEAQEEEDDENLIDEEDMV